MLTSEFAINKLIQFWVTSIISMTLHMIKAQGENMKYEEY